MNRKHRTYSKETEAGWYAIREFVDFNNCATEYDGKPVPMNFKEVQCHLYSKTKILEPFTYSKKLYNDHLRQYANHYYRSKFQARHSVGYQRSDKQAQNAIFAKDLGITSKKKTYSPDTHPYYILLLGFDIDCHNGETDAQNIAEWLKSTYFDQSYWEPSTHFNGRHGYVKLGFPDYLDLDTIKNNLTELFELLDQKRISMGFQAKIDPPCGLPASFYWDNQISVSSPMPKITRQEYSRYRNIRYKLEHGLLTDLNPYISQHRTYEQIDQIVRIPLPWSMKQSQCLKLPRFNHTDPTKATMDDIRSFHNMTFYPYAYITELLSSLKKELHSVSILNNNHSIGSSINKTGKNEPEPIEKACSSSLTIGSERLTDSIQNKATADFPPFQDGNTALLEPDPRTQDPDRIEGEGRRDPVIVRSPHGGLRDPFNLRIGSSEHFTAHHDKNSKRKECRSGNERNIRQYENRIEQIKSITNKAALTSAFYLHYSNYLGRIADIEEAHDEYIRLRLNQTHGKDNPKRIQRLTEARQFVVSLWDDSKRGFKLSEWNQVKSDMISKVSLRMDGLDRSWSKGKKTYEIKIDELALIYYAIGKSNQMDSKKRNLEKGSFSYHQVKECFQLIYGKGCHRAKIARIFKILKEAGLIVLVGDFEVGCYGNKYEAVTEESLLQTVNTSPGSSRLNQITRSDESLIALIAMDPD
jgi:hypothetical protein